VDVKAAAQNFIRKFNAQTLAITFKLMSVSGLSYM